METGSEIPEKLFFRIGEVCDLIKVQPHVLRYWETEFPMLAPQKNRAGQRVYRRKDVEMVMRIRNLLYEEKFTIAGAKRKLQDEIHRTGPRPRAESREAPSPEPSSRVESSIPGPLASIESQSELRHAVSPAPQSDTQHASVTFTPQAKLALRMIKRDLEDLLTMLKSDASIKR
jgi:DNA-binding transcriptional MerR regulator